MKIVPFFNRAGLHIDMNFVQNKNQVIFPGEACNEKLEWEDIVRPDSPAHFMKVNTNLMQDEGIFINDIVVIDPQKECVNGKIVVVLVNNTMMIRRYEKIKSGHMLYGDSNKISPLNIEEGYNQFELLGVVVYVIKSV